tara:strand:+ start:19263 stop:20216 length:954 start_codon:yes stop_codon:yes gene_type:complete
MAAIISIESLNKTYSSGFEALKSIDLEIERGEIFALLGPNGAGKTTLINSVCGLVTPTSGQITVDGFDTKSHYRQARSKIGLVPQEIVTDAFETVRNTVTFSRGLFGKKKNPDFVEEVLRELSLWDKRDSKIMTLSGGMKRRVLIAKALSHEPEILFLDEPTAGVDVELRHSMWQTVHRLREQGTTIILTTHYIEEAEEMADRIGVISDGEIIVVDRKDNLMRKLGKKQLEVMLYEPLSAIPDSLGTRSVELSEDGLTLTYSFDTQSETTGIDDLLEGLRKEQIKIRDLHSIESSLEDIFVSLVHKPAQSQGEEVAS